jgi:hypothetical protein
MLNIRLLFATSQPAKLIERAAVTGDPALLLL